MKTIAELNQKIWYRFLKVLYVLAFLPIFIIPVLFIVSEYSPKFDSTESYILCDNGKILDSTALKQRDIFLWYISSSDENTIKNMCGCDPCYGDIHLKPTENYKLISVYTKRDWGSTFGGSLLSLLIVYMLFATGQRLFYYIVLGSFIPPKQKAVD
jgi:hypothetical protein